MTADERGEGAGEHVPLAGRQRSEHVLVHLVDDPLTRGDPVLAGQASRGPAGPGGRAAR